MEIRRVALIFDDTNRPETTGVYCRPSCPAKRPQRENVEFFRQPDEAEKAGYRACLRCRPRAFSGNGQLEMVKAVCRYIEQCVHKYNRQCFFLSPEQEFFSICTGRLEAFLAFNPVNGTSLGRQPCAERDTGTETLYRFRSGPDHQLVTGAAGSAALAYCLV